MATYSKIPLLAETTDQTLSVELGGSPYILRVLWNERFGYFAVSIYTADDEAIITNVKAVKNYPLFSRFRDVRLPAGHLALVQESGSAARPGYDDLGVSFFLYYIEPDAVAVTVTAPTEPTGAYIGSRWDAGFSEWADAPSWDA